MSFPIEILETFPEAWPSQISEAAAKTVSIELSPEDAMIIGQCSARLAFQKGPFLEDTN